MDQGLLDQHSETPSKKHILVNILLGSDEFRIYSVLLAGIYLSSYVCFIITYAIYKPELLEKSFEWKVYAAYVYMFIILVLLSIDYDYRNSEKKLALKMASNFFFVGSYQQFMYIYDNLMNFTVLYTEIIDRINEISEYFNDDTFWMVMGIIIAIVSVIVIFMAGPVGTVMGVIVIQVVFLIFGIVFFLMIIFPICFYFYQMIVWIIYVPLLVYDLYHNINAIKRIYHSK